MLENSNEIVKKALEKLKEEYGDDFKLEHDDEFVFELNNCTLIIALEKNNLKIKFLGDKPFKLDMSSEIYDSHDEGCSDNEKC